MSALEGVIHVLHGENYFFNFVGRKGLGLFETMAEFSAEGFAANELLIAAHDEGRRSNVGGPGGGIGARSIELAFRIIRRVDVDEFYVPIGISAGGGNEKVRRDGADDGDIFLEDVGLIGEDVVARRGETLI